MAAKQTAFLDGPSPFSAPTYPSQHRFEDEDVKSPYDDLIDQYASPYSANANHNVYAVQTPTRKPSEHLHNPLSPPSHKAPFFHKQSDDISDASHYAYPPLPTKDVDTRSLWQKVHIFRLINHLTLIFYCQILPDSVACRLYVMTVVLQTTIDLTIEGELLVRVNKVINEDDNDPKRQRMPVYLSIFALAQFVV